MRAEQELAPSPRSRLAKLIDFPKAPEPPVRRKASADAFSETKPMQKGVGNPIHPAYGATRPTGEGPKDEAAEELLLDSCETAEHAGAVGVATYGRLVEQREQLAGTSRAASRMRGVTKETNESLAHISWRYVRRKMCLSALIAALALIDGWLFYLLVKHGGKFKDRR